ncbi:unnamed protein product [Rotaria sordida]|uniref:F-box domain-containing protein n=1 Tax=Rotaria sordida TaxID=392033 RepID=A0A815DWA4_9BILA|nr:unnamed protein product [Rotaria sordida]CAF1303543.1 unnamed protein product [Rotaria sordida]
MAHSCIQLNDLPDEILVIIFKKLNNIILLYSLMGINKRLDKILHDSIFTSNLKLLNYSSYDSIYSLSNSMLDRFCLQILPKINNKIKSFNLEISSMKRILLSANYPNLFELGIFNIEKEAALCLVTHQNSLIHMFKNQISSLIIGTKNRLGVSRDVNTLIFTNIFSVFNNLKYFNFDPSSICYQTISFKNSSSPIFSSTTLLELHVKVDVIGDCLYLLDGRFNQLRSFHVHILMPFRYSMLQLNTEKLPNLKNFSLSSCSLKILFYDEIVIPLLHRMLNLEQLNLYFYCSRQKTFVDGNDLRTNILNHLPQLKSFAFNIRSSIDSVNQINLPSNDYIQHTFREFKYKKILSSVDYFPDSNSGECYICSYPFTMTCYERITNNFSGQVFQSVCEVSLYDERSFEHEFFLRIAQSFPFMKKLYVINDKPQNDKQCRKWKDNNNNLLIIEYPYLVHLDLGQAHHDYVEQFLLDSKMSLPINVELHVMYESLKKVTRNFKRNATRINCSKINYICTDRISPYPKHLKDYFRSAYLPTL